MVSALIVHSLKTSALLCQSGQDPSTCLTKTQVDTLEKIYSDYVVDGNWVFGRYYPGGEDAYATGYVEKPSAVSQSWFRYMLLKWVSFHLHERLPLSAVEAIPSGSSGTTTHL